MKKTTLALLGTAVALGAWCLHAWYAPHGHLVEIVQNGRVTATLDLSKKRTPRTIVLNAPGGGTNTLLIQNGRVRVERADCPGNDCVRMGWLRSASAPLVCLPHKLTVRFAAESGTGLDGATQ